MATAKEIRTRINSVKKTKKITRAMEMISASKLFKCKKRMELSKPYAKLARSIIQHLSKGNPEYRHPYLIERKVKRVGFIVISSDRGLCGGLNLNVFKQVLNKAKEFEKQNIKVDLTLIGRKAEAYFSRLDLDILSSVDNLGEKPTVDQLIGSVKVVLDAYDEQKIDQLWLFSNEFISTIKQEPCAEKLLPAAQLLPDALGDKKQDKTQNKSQDKSQDKSKDDDKIWDYIYEPDAGVLLDILLKRYIESQVYQGVVENIACEQAARMVAMKSATDNAGEVINDLQLEYNKARQAAITTELAEICSGSAAV
jgi:F-type H+-transporting ATPase subunit gamma